MNDPLFLFSGDHAEPFSPGVAQSDDEEAEKKKESDVEREVLHRLVLKSRTRTNSNVLQHFTPRSLQTSGTCRFARSLFGLDASVVTMQRSDCSRAYPIKNGSRPNFSTSSSVRPGAYPSESTREIITLSASSSNSRASLTIGSFAHFARSSFPSLTSS